MGCGLCTRVRTYVCTSVPLFGRGWKWAWWVWWVFSKGGWGCGQLGDVPCRNTHVLGGSSHAGSLPPAYTGVTGRILRTHSYSTWLFLGVQRHTSYTSVHISLVPPQALGAAPPSRRSPQKESPLIIDEPILAPSAPTPGRQPSFLSSSSFQLPRGEQRGRRGGELEKNGAHLKLRNAYLTM